MNLSVDYSFSLEYHAHNYAFFLAINPSMKSLNNSNFITVKSHSH